MEQACLAERDRAGEVGISTAMAETLCRLVLVADGCPLTAAAIYGGDRNAFRRALQRAVKAGYLHRIYRAVNRSTDPGHHRLAPTAAGWALMHRGNP